MYEGFRHVIFFPPSVVFPYPVLRTFYPAFPSQTTQFVYVTLAKLQHSLVLEFQTIFQMLLHFPYDHSLYSGKQVSTGTWYKKEDQN
jgi:hypothetical protein